jgi:uncharacterized protein (TIGR02246 family)
MRPLLNGGTLGRRRDHRDVDHDAGHSDVGHSMALREQDIEAIRAVVEKDAEAVRRADWAAVTRMFTVDAVRFPPHQPPVRGRDAMRAWLETFPPIQQFSITADEIVGCGDWAFVRGSYVLTIAPEAGARPKSDRGHYMGLLRKQGDGSWLWATDMVSSELPVTR